MSEQKTQDATVETQETLATFEQLVDIVEGVWGYLVPNADFHMEGERDGDDIDLKVFVPDADDVGSMLGGLLVNLKMIARLVKVQSIWPVSGKSVKFSIYKGRQEGEDGPTYKEVETFWASNVANLRHKYDDNGEKKIYFTDWQLNDKDVEDRIDSLSDDPFYEGEGTFADVHETLSDIITLVIPETDYEMKSEKKQKGFEFDIYFNDPDDVGLFLGVNLLKLKVFQRFARSQQFLPMDGYVKFKIHKGNGETQTFVDLNTSRHRKNVVRKMKS